MVLPTHLSICQSRRGHSGMNLHLFEVALLIHVKETWEKFEGGAGRVPSKHGDCLISLCLLVLVQLMETILLSKFLHVEAARVDSVLWEQQAGIGAGLSYLISMHRAK